MPVLVPLVLGGLIAITFVVWEWKFAELPLIPSQSSHSNDQHVLNPHSVHLPLQNGHRRNSHILSQRVWNVRSNLLPPDVLPARIRVLGYPVGISLITGCFISK